MSIRVRLTVVNVVVFALAFGVLGLLLRDRMRANLIAGVDRGLLERVRPIEGFWHHRPPNDFPGFGGGGPDGFRRPMNQDANRPRLFESDGSPVRFEPPREAFDRTAILHVVTTGQPLFQTLVSPEEPPQRLLTYPLHDATRKVNGAAQAIQSVEAVEIEVDRLTRTLLTQAPLALLLAALAGAFLTGRALAPVAQVTAAAERIGVSDLGNRLPVSGHDEFARLARTFNGMLERLETAFDQQRRFVADASHELKTPLTVIKANTSLALAEPDLDGDVRETLTEIDRAADRTNRIVHDLLLLARTDAGALPLSRETLQATTLFDAVRHEVRRLHPNGATLRCQPNGVLIDADPHLLHRLLLNLTDNALRHTPGDGCVTLEARSDKTTVALVVRDTGQGIPADALPHITERFFRVDAARSRGAGGSGLGLAIARALAEAHGGTLTLQSTVGQGTTATVRLPCAASA
jgi:signal transduction histidine kinase